jgi:cysteine desulfurase
VKDSVVYLDNNASSPVDPRVLEAMLPIFTEIYANPSSATHIPGRQAAEVVEQARIEVAELIGAESREIVFTGGATEANNLAILGLAAAAPPGTRVVTTAIEHKSVLAPIAELARRGVASTVLGVDRLGRVDLAGLEQVLAARDVLLISVQAANSEVGTIQDIATVAKMAHAHDAIVHCDAVQAAGKIPVDVEAWGVDLLTLNAHKLYGPKGVGALFLAGGPRAWPLRPLTFGGSQEYGLRPGTLDTPAIAGFGAAAQIAREELAADAAYATTLRDQFERCLQELVGGVVVNGDKFRRLPGTTSLTFNGVDAEALLARLPGVAASTVSACNSGALEPSHVLLAMGRSQQEAYQTVRFTFGRLTEERSALDTAHAVATAVEVLRALGAENQATSR